MARTGQKMPVTSPGAYAVRRTFLRTLGIEISFSREGRAGTRTITISSAVEPRSERQRRQQRQRELPPHLAPLRTIATSIGALAVHIRDADDADDADGNKPRGYLNGHRLSDRQVAPMSSP